MDSRVRFSVLFWLTPFVTLGCSSAGGQLGTLQTQNRSLLEQNRVQLAEIENLKTHSRRVEDKLIDAERRLVALEKQETPESRTAVRNRETTSSSLFDRSSDSIEGNAAATAESDTRR